MNRAVLANVALRVRLALARTNPVGPTVALLLATAVAASGWTAHQRTVLARQTAAAAQAAAVPVQTPTTDAPPVDDNLAAFYRSLGDRRHAEQQLAAMFALASKTGLVLNKGEYREAYNSNGKLYTYQITLPVKGNYRAIWDFAERTLAAIPFASLDEVNFRRDAIGDANVEARLRFTLYLGRGPAGEGT